MKLKNYVLAKKNSRPSMFPLAATSIVVQVTILKVNTPHYSTTVVHPSCYHRKEKRTARLSRENWTVTDNRTFT